MIRRLFLDRNYLAFFSGWLLADFAIQIQRVAIAWHVYALHHRAFDLALVGLVLFLPNAAFALVAGVFADRHDRRAIAVAGGILEGLISLAFLALVAADVREVSAYLALLAVLGTVRTFTAPAERAILPSIVARERYVVASATYASAREIAVIAGPAAGGVLVAFGTPLAFGVTAVALFVAAGIVATLRLAFLEPVDPPTLRDALGGVRFIGANPSIAGAISLDLFAVLFGGVTAVLPIYADAILHVGPLGLGALTSAPAVGATLVAFAVARRPIERHVGRTLLVAVASFGAAIVAFGISTNLAFSLAMLAVAGGADMVSVVIRGALVQLGTPSEMRGRVNAVENVFIGASNELGAFESGALASLLGTVPSVIAGGIGTLVVVALWAAAFPGLRRADRFDSADERLADPA